MIRAAGVVLWREPKPFDLEIALVHRPQFDDWTFPKGKIEEGESAIQAAYRETFEETGIKAEFGPYLGHVEYEVDGNKKKVQYWMAKAPDGEYEFIGNDEIDRIEWVTLKQARHFLSYDIDRDVLKFFRDAERHTSTLILLRHAKAIKRSDWNGDDSDRPLDVEGQVIAQKLAAQFEMFNINEIHTSDAYRCMSTVEPFHAKFGIPKQATDQLSEYRFEKDSKAASEYIKQLTKFGGNYLVCGHNPILGIAIEELIKHPSDFVLDKELHPGDAWVIHHRAGKVFAANFLKAPTI